MSQFVDNHPLGRDLPEFKEAIHVLKTDNAHFAKLMASYEAIDKEIVRAEQGLELKVDEEMNSLKMKRVAMKDTLLELLKKHSANT